MMQNPKQNYTTTVEHVQREILISSHSKQALAVTPWGYYHKLTLSINTSMRNIDTRAT